MSTPEVVTTKSKSEGAKRMWERRRLKMEAAMKNEVPIKAWVYHTEWLALMGTIVVMFSWMHHEYTHTNKRLDDHMEAINRRCDESNKRTDELHKEFYDLLKEMRRN